VKKVGGKGDRPAGPGLGQEKSGDETLPALVKSENGENEPGKKKKDPQSLNLFKPEGGEGGNTMDSDVGSRLQDPTTGGKNRKTRTR